VRYDGVNHKVDFPLLGTNNVSYYLTPKNDLDDDESDEKEEAESIVFP
jgi:hypothetical protein